MVRLSRASRLDKNGNKVQTHGILTVRKEIAALIPDNMRFNAELTEEGILFRLVPAELLPVADSSVSWTSPQDASWQAEHALDEAEESVTHG